jgi:AcrR family transcriptional regulator
MSSDVASYSTAPRARGRPRNFDSDAAVLCIRDCFAQHGYAGASINDLSKATGLSTASLYNAFGDKRSMFLKALDLEYAEVTGRLRHLTRLDSLRDRVRGFIDALRIGHGGSKLVPGVALSTALSDYDGDPEIEARIKRFVYTLNVAAQQMLRQTDSSPASDILSTLAIGSCVRSRFSDPCQLDFLDLAPLLSTIKCR